MARMRPVLFSSTSAAPCTVGRTRSCAEPLLTATGLAGFGFPVRGSITTGRGSLGAGPLAFT